MTAAAADLTPLIELERLLERYQHLWRGREMTETRADTFPTGFTELDAALPGGGWPRKALLELIVPRWGIGELQLLLPLLATLGKEARWSMWVDPPFIPYAPALAEAGVNLDRTLLVTPRRPATETAWCMEKALSAGTCALVMAWGENLPDRTLRRLQLAAERGGSLGILFRTREHGPSPAAVRIRLEPAGNGLDVEILKARGGLAVKKRLLKLEQSNNTLRGSHHPGQWQNNSG